MTDSWGGEVGVDDLTGAAGGGRGPKGEETLSPDSPC